MTLEHYLQKVVAFSPSLNKLLLQSPSKTSREKNPEQISAEV